MLRLVYNGISKFNDKSKLKCSFMDTLRSAGANNGRDFSWMKFLQVIRQAAIVSNEAEQDSPERGKVTSNLNDKCRTNKADCDSKKSAYESEILGRGSPIFKLDYNALVICRYETHCLPESLVFSF